MSSSTEFLSNIKEASHSLISTRRPWSQFLDPYALSLPTSLSVATTRISQNLSHFLFNYTLVVLLTIFLSLIYHPFALIVFIALFAAWYFLYFSRDENLNLFNLVVLDDRAVVLGLLVLTLVALFATGVWLNVVVSVIVGGAVVCLHGALRGTEDLVEDDINESPYGPMLSDAGAYTSV